MARELVYLGKTYRMSIAQLDTVSGEVSILRFENEICNTRFIDGRIRLSVSGTPGAYRWAITQL